MYYTNNDIRIEEMPVPSIGRGELLVRIEASGICGSDIMEWYRAGRAPLVLGHEVAGEIVKIGDRVKKFKEGERITASHHVPCNTCSYCLNGHHTSCDTLRKTNFDPGGFAEYVRLPSINVDRGVYPLPDELSFEEATFTEPLACVLRGQKRAQLKPGKSVLVIGSGIAGILHIQLASVLGASNVVATDTISSRLKKAKHFGANVIFNAREYTPDQLKKVNGNHLADLVVVCTGATQAFHQAFQSVERGGVVLLFAPTNQGVTIPLSINNFFWRNDITLTTSYAGSPADHVTALKLINAKSVNVRDMITHRLPLEKIGYGFQLVAQAQDSLKVIIEPQK
jgi:L-iditol 2-dehydrogenase